MSALCPSSASRVSREAVRCGTGQRADSRLADVTPQDSPRDPESRVPRAGWGARVSRDTAGDAADRRRTHHGTRAGTAGGWRDQIRFAQDAGGNASGNASPPSPSRGTRAGTAGRRREQTPRLTGRQRERRRERRPSLAVPRDARGNGGTLAGSEPASRGTPAGTTALLRSPAGRARGRRDARGTPAGTAGLTIGGSMEQNQRED